MHPHCRTVKATGCRARCAHAAAGRLDSEGRAYSTPVHPALRAWQWRTADRPLLAGTGHQLLTWPAPPDTRFVLASSHGYGFVTRFENLIGRNKAGKAMLNLSAGSSVLTRRWSPTSPPTASAVTSSGNLLAIAANDLPELDKARATRSSRSRRPLATERVVAIVAISPGQPCRCAAASAPWA